MHSETKDQDWCGTLPHKGLEEPRADERERTMGFSTSTTTAPEMTEVQRR